MSKQYIQPREDSDHCAIVVKSWVKDWGPKPFKTVDAWLLEPGFKELVKGKWNSYEVQGNSMGKVKEKLRCLKGDLKEWDRSVFEILEENKRLILKEIEKLDIKDANCDLAENEKLRRMDILSQQGLVEKKMESLYRQKARSNWFKHGDSNSKIYHSLIRWRRLKNEVKGVELADQWCEEPEVVRREAKRVFEQRFKATTDLGIKLEEVDFKSLPEAVSLSMVEVFSETEVKEAVWMCVGSKSPGPYGFNFNFIKSNWETLKEDIMEVVYSFQESGIFPMGCNESFIALVPKVKDPVMIDQFRPISLVGTMYKIITKAMSHHIKNFLPLVIDENQSVFLKGRGMLESVLMANEVIEEVRRCRRSGVFFKVDFEKAYDSVRWSFLLDMFHRMGFHSKWIKWVQGCLESATVLVLINGSPTKEFKPSRGLRQGDPLAPFLFLIVAEGLAGLVRNALKENVLKGVKVGRAETECCMLQFVDDTLFMCEESFSNIFTIKTILRVFELASGLKVNFHKSKLAGIKVERNSLELYARTLNCGVMQIPFKYLGMQVGGNPRRRQFWEPVMDKVEARLSAWNGKCLSLAGRVCLVKSVLTSIPLFYLSFFKAPHAVCHKISSIQRGFLWTGGDDQKHISWVSWENVCKPKEEGGLGIKDIRMFNCALLAKWKWRMLSEEKGKWKDILLSKYSPGTVSNSKTLSWWWKDLSKASEEGEEEGWFPKHVAWKVGSGDKVRFWEDTWVENKRLKTLFPRLFSVSLDQRKTMVEVGSWEDSDWNWWLRWRRARFSWKSVMEGDLLNLITGKTLSKEAKDTLVWSGDQNGAFSVKSAYLNLRHQHVGSSNEIFSLLWEAKAMPKALVTAWRILLGRLPTYDNLIRRGLVVTSSSCVFCNVSEESTQHIFLDCALAQSVWSLCFRWIGIFSVQHKDILVHFESFQLPHFTVSQNQIWKGIWVAIVRCIWDQRNLIVLKQGVVDADEIVHLAQLAAWLRLKHGPSLSTSPSRIGFLIRVSAYKIVVSDGDEGQVLLLVC